MLQYLLIKIRTPYFPPHFPPCFIKYCDFIKIAKLIDTDLKRPAKLGIERNSYRHRSYAGTDTGLGSRILFNLSIHYVLRPKMPAELAGIKNVL